MRCPQPTVSVPMPLATGTGAEVQKPLATVVIGRADQRDLADARGPAGAICAVLGNPVTTAAS